MYAVKVLPSDRSLEGLYACFESYHGDDLRVDIPIRDDTPEGVLAEEFYLNTTFFGEIDMDKLTAFLNKRAFPEGGNFVDWFEENLGERKGEIHIGSHGGMNEYGYDHAATIELDMRRSGVIMPLELFASRVNASLPHLIVEPLAKDGYLLAVASNLPFQPKDWSN